MTPHTLTKTHKTAPKAHALSAVDYFQAKLDFETTPWSLKETIEKTPEKVFVLDVRTADKFAAGHIPGATNVPLADLPAKLATLPKDRTIVTYCGNITCWLAPKAALQLAQKGFAVQMLFGGFEEWSKKGFPIE